MLCSVELRRIYFKNHEARRIQISKDATCTFSFMLIARECLLYIRVFLYKGLRIFTICSKNVVGQFNCWFLVCKWSVMENQLTSSYKWLPVFTLLTIDLDMTLYSHKGRTQNTNLQFIINGKFYLIILLD